MKNKLSKLYKVFLAVGMVFSMCFNTLGMSVVNAYDPSVPKEFTRVKNISFQSGGAERFHPLLHGQRIHVNTMANGLSVWKQKRRHLQAVNILHRSLKIMKT